MVFGDYDEKPRTRISKVEWEAVKALHGNKCMICGKSEKIVGTLAKAHLKAHSKGGTQYFPLCKNHHAMFDKGQLTSSQLKKLGIDKNTYDKLKPKSTKKSTGGFWGI